MEGRFDISVLDMKGISDEDVRRAQNDGTIEALLAGIPVVRKLPTVRNMLFDNVCAYLMHRLPNQGSLDISLEPTYPVNLRPTNITWSPSCLGGICLTSVTSNPTYFEFTNEGSITLPVVDNSVNPTVNNTDARTLFFGAGRRFISDQILRPNFDPDRDTIVDTGGDGREDIEIKFDWLYSTVQAAPTSILRSISILFRERPDQNVNFGTSTGKIGRVRLKDENGQNVELTLDSTFGLYIRYRVRFVSF